MASLRQSADGNLSLTEKEQLLKDHFNSCSLNFQSNRIAVSRMRAFLQKNKESLIACKNPQRQPLRLFWKGQVWGGGWP